MLEINYGPWSTGREKSALLCLSPASPVACLTTLAFQDHWLSVPATENFFPVWGEMLKRNELKNFFFLIFLKFSTMSFWCSCSHFSSFLGSFHHVYIITIPIHLCAGGCTLIVIHRVTWPKSYLSALKIGNSCHIYSLYFIYIVYILRFIYVLSYIMSFIISL